MARWLFVLPGQAGDRPPAFNAIGARLADAARTAGGRPRVWVDLNQDIEQAREFQSHPLHLLAFNSLLPLSVVRGKARWASDGPPGPLEVAGRLRVLLVLSNPDPLPPASFVTEGEPYPHLSGLAKDFDDLKAALDPLVNEEALVFEESAESNPLAVADAADPLQPAPPRLRRPRRLTRPDLRRGGAAGALPFPDVVAAVRQAREPALRLAMLIACYSRAAAPLLLEAGVPAVEAMLGRFPVAAMPVFAQQFFGKLARFGPLTEAHEASVRELAQRVRSPRRGYRPSGRRHPTTTSSPTRCRGSGPTTAPSPSAGSPTPSPRPRRPGETAPRGETRILTSRRSTSAST